MLKRSTQPHGRFILGRLLLLLAVASLSASGFAQQPVMLPYVTIDAPQFVHAAAADFLKDDYVVLGVATGTVAKAYPAADLAQHGSALDTMPDGPITITWCGVCNAGVVYRRNLGQYVLHFDYDSMLHGNEVHKDRETGSRWQQALGEAIDGPLKGRQLTPYPFIRTTWGEWKRQYPGTLVMQPLAGYAQRMPLMHQLSRSAYVGEGEAPAEAAFRGDFRVRPRELVAGLQVGAAAKAYPFSALRAARVVNDSVGGNPVLIVHQPGSDTTTAFIPRAKGRPLSFFPAVDGAASELVDRQTRSRWTPYGLATQGPLKGTQLQGLILVPQFWFAWSQFHPSTELFLATTALPSVVWEPLLRAPLPPDAISRLIALKLTVSPARTGTDSAGPGHQHGAPVMAYLLKGRIENEMEHGPLRVYERDGFFYEAPGQVRKTLRNLSRTRPAEILIFTGDDAGKEPAPLIAAPLTKTVDKEISLLRLTLGAGATAAAPPHSDAALVYVLAGTIETTSAASTSESHAAGSIFVVAPHEGTLRYRNKSRFEAARILMFAATTRPMAAPSQQ
jgi:hypothetical protein